MYNFFMSYKLLSLTGRNTNQVKIMIGKILLQLSIIESANTVTLVFSIVLDHSGVNFNNIITSSFFIRKCFMQLSILYFAIQILSCNFLEKGNWQLNMLVGEIDSWITFKLKYSLSNSNHFLKIHFIYISPTIISLYTTFPSVQNKKH